MARGKKKESTLTPEEKLAQALVPDWEQPYTVPENWCWTKISNVAELLNGFAFKSQQYTDEGIRIIRIANVQDGYVEDDAPAFYPVESTKEIERYLLHAGDLLLSLTGNVGRAALLPASLLPAALNQRVACLRNSGAINKKFLFYYLLRKEFQESCIKNSKGSAQLNMSTEWLKEQPLCIPPLAEQQRIVDRIEYLFAKLDEAKEKAQSVLDSFETRKAAILHRAFTGELTAKWRVERGLERSSWQFKPWGELICSIEAGKNWNAEGRPPQSDEFGVVKVSSVTWGEFDELESKTCVVQDQWNEKVQIKSGDFLFSRANTLQLVGNCVIVKNITRRLMLSDKILRFSFTDAVNPYYVLFYTRSQLYRQQAEQQASGNQDGMRNISQKNLRLIEIPMPSFVEQEAIVRILDSLFAKEQQAKEAAEAVLEKIDLLKKSILARAFRGELGTNAPTEESALELLKQVLQEDAPEVTRKRSKSIPKELQVKLATDLERKIVKLYFKQETDSLPAEELLAVSSKKFEVMETLRDLEQRKLLKKLPNGNYRILE